MARDLRFAWEEMPQQILDEQAQKVRESLHAALIGWATATGEGSDYTDNLPLQCLHPVGHWYEVPNMLKNGVLATLLRERPGLQYLMVHNIDALGTDADPGVLGWVMENGAAFTAEVITRSIEDRGGGWRAWMAGCGWWKGWPCPGKRTSSGSPTTTRTRVGCNIDRLLAVFGLDRETIMAAAGGDPEARPRRRMRS